MRLKLLSIIFFFSATISFSQSIELSENSEISIITIGPGNSLIDSFGHSAIRVFDGAANFDTIFNYGVYDFDTPNFILKFARGKLNYKLEKRPSSRWLQSYVYQDRTIKEQILNLSQEQKQSLYVFLIDNEKPENRYYLYDFFYDNCASVIRDVINNEIDDSVIFNTPKGFEQKTFRRLIHSKLNKNSWGSLGIDVALGSVIDKKASNENHMFLPDFIHTFFKNATYKNSGQSLVKQSRVLYKQAKTPPESSFITSPLFVFGIISFIILGITYNDYKKNRQTKILDFILFLITGLIGVFILLLWFATDHTATAMNYNLLWGLPINLFIALQLWKQKVWFVKYLKFLVIALCLLTLHWFIGVQIFAIGLIPLLVTLLIRYVYLIKYYTPN